MPDGTFRDIAHPIKIEFREQLEKQVLDEYFRVIGVK
jgi:DNA-binding cell septation regulator SpoVG